jgi:hypothetical protein
VYIPDGSNAGTTAIGITGTVEMPSYSRKDLRGSESNLAAFRAAVAKKEVPWFEVIGDSYAFTYPIGMAHLYQDPDAVIDVMEESLSSIRKTLTLTSPSTQAIPPMVTSAFLLSFRT